MSITDKKDGNLSFNKQETSYLTSIPERATSITASYIKKSPSFLDHKNDNVPICRGRARSTPLFSNYKQQEPSAENKNAVKEKVGQNKYKERDLTEEDEQNQVRTRSNASANLNLKGENSSVFIEENRDEEKRSKTSYSDIVEKLLLNNKEDYKPQKGIAGHIEDLYLSKNIVIKRIDNNEFNEWNKLFNESDILKKNPASVPSFLKPIETLAILVLRLKPYGNISKNVESYFKKSKNSKFLVMENIARDNLFEEQKELTAEEIYKNIKFIAEKTRQKNDALILGTKKLRKISNTEYKDWLKLKNAKSTDKSPSFEGPWEGYYSMLEAIKELYPNKDKKKTETLIKEVEKHFITSRPKNTSGKIYDERSLL